MTDTIKTYLGASLAILLGGFLIVQTVRLHDAQMDLAKAKTELANQKSLASESLAASTVATRETEIALGSKAADTRKETNEQIRNLTAQRDALLRRVLNAELEAAAAAVVSKAASTPIVGGASKGSLGAELPATLGQEDVEEAHRADTIRLQLAACYRQYNEAKKALSQ